MHLWADEQLDWIRNHLHMTKVDLAAGVTKQFGFLCTENMIKGVFARYGIRSGRSGRFSPGSVPHNKGKKGLVRASSTSFKPGNIPQNWVPVGSERNNSGIIEVKVSEPHGWRSKHVLIWESVNGPVPDGHVVVFADRDRSNFDAANLLCVSRAELVVMNKRGLITDHAEATRVGRMVARVVLAKSRKRKGRHQKELVVV